MFQLLKNNATGFSTGVCARGDQKRGVGHPGAVV